LEAFYSAFKAQVACAHILAGASLKSQTVNLELLPAQIYQLDYSDSDDIVKFQLLFLRVCFSCRLIHDAMAQPSDSVEFQHLGLHSGKLTEMSKFTDDRDEVDYLCQQLGFYELGF
jgi:hypothetical protein